MDLSEQNWLRKFVFVSVAIYVSVKLFLLYSVIFQVSIFDINLIYSILI